MIAFQVYSPFTGQHTRYETEQEAKAAVIEIIKEVTKDYYTFVNQETTLENGDTVWSPTDLCQNINITIDQQ
jgi:hypothetical protein